MAYTLFSKGRAQPTVNVRHSYSPFDRLITFVKSEINVPSIERNVECIIYSGEVERSLSLTPQYWNADSANAETLFGFSIHDQELLLAVPYEVVVSLRFDAREGGSITIHVLNDRATDEGYVTVAEGDKFMKSTLKAGSYIPEVLGKPSQQPATDVLETGDKLPAQVRPLFRFNDGTTKVEKDGDTKLLVVHGPSNFPYYAKYIGRWHPTKDVKVGGRAIGDMDLYEFAIRQNAENRWFKRQDSEDIQPIEFDENLIRSKVCVEFTDGERKLRVYSLASNFALWDGGVLSPSDVTRLLKWVFAYEHRVYKDGSHSVSSSANLPAFEGAYTAVNKSDFEFIVLPVKVSRVGDNWSAIGLKDIDNLIDNSDNLAVEFVRSLRPIGSSLTSTSLKASVVGESSPVVLGVGCPVWCLNLYGMGFQATFINQFNAKPAGQYSWQDHAKVMYRLFGTAICRAKNGSIDINFDSADCPITGSAVECGNSSLDEVTFDQKDIGKVYGLLQSADDHIDLAGPDRVLNVMVMKAAGGYSSLALVYDPKHLNAGTPLIAPSFEWAYQKLLSYKFGAKSNGIELSNADTMDKVLKGVS